MARLKASKSSRVPKAKTSKATKGNLVDLSAVADQHFLSRVIEELERLRSDSDNRGHPFLSSMLDIARRAAADELKTELKIARIAANRTTKAELGADEEDAMLRIAQKLAWRR